VFHADETKHRVFEVVVVEVLDRAPEPNRLLRRPDGIRIEAETIARECGSERAITLEIVLERKHAAFQFVRAKPILRLQYPGMRNELVGCAHGACPARIRVAMKEIRGK